MEQAGAVPSSLTGSRGFLKLLWKHRVFYMFLLPAIAFSAVFFYRPYVWLAMAFEDFTFRAGLWGSPFVGLKHFRWMLSNPDFLKALRNTVSLNLLAFAVGFPAPILFALFINEVWSTRFKKITQTITYMPHFVSWVIVSGLFYRLLDFYSGSVNELIAAIGLGRVAFMREPDWFQPIMITLTVWKETGWYSIIYLAALSGVDQDLYAAAEVDGANRFQQTIHVTLPAISTTIVVMLIMTVGRIATGGGIIPSFDSVFPMLNPFLYETGEILQVHVYLEGLKFNRLSYAAAVGITQSAFALLLVVSTNWIVRRTRGYGVY